MSAREAKRPGTARSREENMRRIRENGALGQRRDDALRIGGGHTRWWRGAREHWIRGGERGRSPQKEPRRRGEKRTPRGTRGPTDQAGPRTATRAEAQGREPKWLRDLDAEKGSRVQGTAKEAKRGRGGQKGGKGNSKGQKDPADQAGPHKKQGAPHWSGAREGQKVAPKRGRKGGRPGM